MLYFEDVISKVPNDERLKVARKMIACGGSFFEGIGLALINADDTNTMKIKETWPDVWERFKKAPDLGGR